MTWTRLEDDFTDSPRMVQVSRSARLLHVEGLVWCNKHLTDGKIPTALLRRLTDATDPDADLMELVTIGLWEEVDGGWQLDWANQESSSRVKERRDLNTKRQNDYRERGHRHKNGDHSLCTDGCPNKGVTQDVTRYVTQSERVSNGTPSRPDPTPREGEGKRQELRPDGARSAGAPRSQSGAGVPHIGPPPGTVIVPVIDWGDDD